MRGLKKPLGVILLLTMMGIGGTSALADGVTEIPTRSIAQNNPDPTSDGASNNTYLAEMVSYMISILPL